MAFYLAKLTWVIHQVIGLGSSHTGQLLQINTMKEKSNTDLFNNKKVRMKYLLIFLVIFA